MAGDGRHLAAAPARTVGAARSVAVPARQAGARPRTVPVRLRGARRGAAPVRRPLMARAGIPRRTRAAVDRQRARATGPVGRHARPPETHGGGQSGLREQRPGVPGRGERRVREPGRRARGTAGPAASEYRGRSRTSDDGGFRPAPRSAPGEGSRDRTSAGGRPGRTAEGGFRRDAEADSDFRGARRPTDTGSRRTAPGDARRSPRPAGSSARPAAGSYARPRRREPGRFVSRAPAACGRRAVPS